MKKIISFVLVIMMVVSILPSAFAAENEVILREISREYIYLEDGSYFEAIEYEHIYPNAARLTETITRTQSYTYHDALNTPLYRLKLTASFAITDNFVRATSASYNKEIYQSLYRFGGGNAYCSGEYAVATGTFNDSLGNRHRTLSITARCDANGNVTYTFSNY